MDGNNSFHQYQTNSCLVNSEEHPASLCCGTELHSSNSKSLGVGEHVSSKTGNLTITKKARSRSSSDTRDHIMCERKRRQQLAERFIALSAIIPGLKKIDKATILGEAINYVKQLEGRIAVLEQESKKKSTKSMMLIKKSQYASCETNSNSYLGYNHVLPEVEATGLESGKEVLIRILCEKRNGIMLKLLNLLQNIHLSIVSSSVLPFGKNTLNITVIAQMGEEYNMKGDLLVKSLTQDLLKLYDVQLSDPC